MRPVSASSVACARASRKDSSRASRRACSTGTRLGTSPDRRSCDGPCTCSRACRMFSGVTGPLSSSHHPFGQSTHRPSVPQQSMPRSKNWPTSQVVVPPQALHRPVTCTPCVITGISSASWVNADVILPEKSALVDQVCDRREALLGGYGWWRGVVVPLVSEKCPQDVDSSPGQRQDCLGVLLALGSFAVVVPARFRAAGGAAHGCKVLGPLQTSVISLRPVSVAADLA